MGVTYERFMGIAKECKAWDILECWDKSFFNMNIELFGPMTEEDAYSTCHRIKAITDEELAAAEYFGRG